MDTPTRKVTSAGLAGALTVVAVWILQAATAIEVPAEVAAAITTVLTFATGYLVSED